MTEQMTPLRRRMIDDMTIRNMSPSTQKIYIRAVAHFSAYHGRSPDASWRCADNRAAEVADTHLAVAWK